VLKEFSVPGTEQQSKHWNVNNWYKDILDVRNEFEKPGITTGFRKRLLSLMLQSSWWWWWWWWV